MSEKLKNVANGIRVFLRRMSVLGAVVATSIFVYSASTESTPEPSSGKTDSQQAAPARRSASKPVLDSRGGAGTSFRQVSEQVVTDADSTTDAATHPVSTPATDPATTPATDPATTPADPATTPGGYGDTSGYGDPSGYGNPDGYGDPPSYGNPDGSGNPPGSIIPTDTTPPTTSETASFPSAWKSDPAPAPASTPTQSGTPPTTPPTTPPVTSPPSNGTGLPEGRVRAAFSPVTGATVPDVMVVETDGTPSLQGVGGPPVDSFLEIFDFDVTPDWVLQRWTYVSNVGPLHTRGYRVPLSTGPGASDLVGSLTYYFDAHLELEKITFEGYTGDISRLVLTLRRFQMSRRFTSDPNLERYESPALSGDRRSYMQTYHRLVPLDANNPNKKFWITMELYPPEE